MHTQVIHITYTMCTRDLTDYIPTSLGTYISQIPLTHGRTITCTLTDNNMKL